MHILQLYDSLNMNVDGRDDTVFPISVRPISLTESGAQCILGRTVVDFTKNLAL